MSNLQVDLYDEDTETEVSVCAEYSIQPAEPDVGIPVAFGELQNVSMWIPGFGSIMIDLDEHYTEIVEQAIADEIFEDECSGGYRG